MTSEWLARVVALEQAGQAMPWSGDQLQNVFEDERAHPWGAWQRDCLVGYAVLYRLPFEAELQTLVVAAEARRCGVARALVERLVEEATRWESERLLLEVGASNRAALGLYEKLGFRRDGRRRDYYRDPSGQYQDAVLMSLLLPAGRVA
ncbi:ribosomal-protein-alanine N-acetyltransferase [Modicisalibacter ilicicola DSM 19980]|uniref:[Ribosomal protein bS18]-alanine N-acetyltransferase n=1 Tax=Modicisalibacter ilicicola DSM 19980 TaxID=1121942 RepID=A0A1M4V9M8_9GAMM|nr:ribosomal-protein-alanine N-acetyltransferase [Halomonas ilicicola DSM 19980]